MEKAGVRLKKIRLDKGISLEEVAKQTKITISTLRSIEDDGFVNIDPVYVKGFVKMYCEFLGVNPADYIAEYKPPQVEMRITDRSEQADAYLNPSSDVKKPPVIMRAALIGSCVIVGLLVLFFLVKGIVSGVAAISKSFKKRPHAEIVAAAKKSGAAKTAKKPSRPAKSSAAPKQARNSPARAVTVSSTTTTTNTAASSGTSSQASGPIRLGIHAKNDCWVQVKVDGKTIFQGMLARGRIESWKAETRIDLSLGNAGAVDLEINGNRVMPLGRKGQVVRDIRINKDGSVTTKDGSKLNR
jgi:cytoskeletal protein RodZ